MFSRDLDLSAAARGVWGDARPEGSCVRWFMVAEPLGTPRIMEVGE